MTVDAVKMATEVHTAVEVIDHVLGPPDGSSGVFADGVDGAADVVGGGDEEGVARSENGIDGVHVVLRGPRKTP